jgi:hypothetical protein
MSGAGALDPTEYYRLAYTTSNWYAGTGLNIANFSQTGKDLSGLTALRIGFKQTGAAINEIRVNLVSGYDATKKESKIYSITSIPTGSYQLFTIGSNSFNTNNGFTYSNVTEIMIGVIAPDGTSGTLDIDGIALYGVTNIGSPPVTSTNGITIANMHLSASVVTNNKANPLTLTLKAWDSNGTIFSVVANLSSVNGSPNSVMSKIGTSSNYSLSFTVPSGLTAGTKIIKVIATDNSGNTLTNALLLTVAKSKTSTALNTFTISPNPLILSGDNMNASEFTFAYKADATAEVTMEIYSITGDYINTLKDESKSGKFTWDGKNANGTDAVSGIYLVYLKVNGVAIKPAAKIGIRR